MRSVLEYCSPVYHSPLNVGQAEALERLHRHAVRICFGFDVPIETIFEENDIETLEARRLRRCDRFLTKLCRNPRFREKWLKTRPSDGHHLRNRRAVMEMNASTVRRFNSPVFFLRRRANELGLLRTEED